MDPLGQDQGQSQPTLPSEQTNTAPTTPHNPSLSGGLPTTDITPQTQLKRHKLPLIVIILAIVVGISIILFVFGRGLTPEQQLTKALEQSLSVKTLTQHYKTTNTDDGGTVTIAAKTDFTDPAKAKIEGPFTLSLSQEGQNFDVAYDMVCLPEAAYLRLTKLESPLIGTEAADPVEALKNKWYNAKDDTSSFLSTGLDESCTALRTPLGEVITGNFSEPLRTEILDKIAADKPYTIKESGNVTEDGKKLLRLKVALDEQKVRALNEMAAGKLGIEKLDQDSGNIEEAVLFIDTDSNRIVRVEAKGSENEEITITYSDFNQPLNIAQPKPVLSKDELKSLLADNLLLQ